MDIKLTKAEAEIIIMNTRKAIAESKFFIEKLIEAVDVERQNDPSYVDPIQKGVDYHNDLIKTNNKILKKLGASQWN